MGPENEHVYQILNRCTNWQLQNSHRDVAYSIGNVVSDVVVAMYSARSVLGMLGEHFVKRIIVCHRTVHLRPTQSNVEGELLLKTNSQRPGDYTRTTTA